MITVRLYDDKNPGIFLGAQTIKAEDLDEFDVAAGGLGIRVEIVE